MSDDRWPAVLRRHVRVVRRAGVGAANAGQAGTGRNLPGPFLFWDDVAMSDDKWQAFLVFSTVLPLGAVACLAADVFAY